MDPVAILFSAYLDAVQSSVHSHLTDSLGTELKAVVIEYQGMAVPFQYQMWRVREQSVCTRYSEDIALQSACTLKAKALFTELCTTLSATPSNHWRHTKSKNMYCNASVTYKPLVARVAPSHEPSALAKVKADCSAATVAAMGNSDAALIRTRDEVCGVYRGMKE